MEEYYHLAVYTGVPVIIQGETGSGKTAILCKLIERLQSEGKHVFMFFPGVGSKSDTAESLVQQMVYYMEKIKEKPAKRWDGLVDKIVWSVAAAVVGFLLAKIGL